MPVSVTAPAHSDDDTAQAASTSVAAEQTARETAAQTVAQNAEQADRAERADQVVKQQASVKETVERAASTAGAAKEAAVAESAAEESGAEEPAAKEPEAQENPEQAQRARREAIAAVLFSDKGVSEPKLVQQVQPAVQKAKAETADKPAANKAAESKAAEGKTSEGKAATETAETAAPAVTAETAETAHNNQTRAQRTRRRLAITPTFSEPEPEQEEPHRRLTRAMSALLFQEPVLPATNASAPSAEPSPAFEEEEEAGHRRHRSRSHSSRRLNSSERAAAAEVDSIEQEIASEEEERGTRSRRRRRGAEANETAARSRAITAARDDDEHDSETAEGKSAISVSRRRKGADGENDAGNLEPNFDEERTTPTRHRRRSLEEIEARRQARRAAREQEREQRQEQEDEEDREEGVTRRRRRRSADRAASRAERNADRSADRASREERDEASESTILRTRTRNRSRRLALPEPSDSMEPLPATHAERKQAYISRIKDVKGSTRLEAKRRHRRDTRRTRSQHNLVIEQDFLARRENVDRQMIVREKGHHTQISVIEDNILVEHYVSDIQEVSTVGNIYVGRVQNVLPSMEAAFVNIGEARNGVLYAGEVNWDDTQLEGEARRIERAYHSGDPVLVQVTKDAIGHKGARLTSQVTLAGRYIVLVPSGGMTGVSRKLSSRERLRLKRIVQAVTPKDMGVIIRTAAEGASKEAVEADLKLLLERWEGIQKRYNELKDTHRPHILHSEPDVAIRVVRDIFNDDFRQLVVEGEHVYDRIHGYLEEMSPELLPRLKQWDPAEHQGADVFDQWNIDSQLRKGMERQVYLPSGGSLVIDRTEAMTTIDVNTGRFIGKGKSLEETVTRCNLEAAEEIVRQLRLRDIGGMIMIDFVDMVMEENRDLVLRRLVECLTRDRTKHQVAEVTSLGLVQMTRKRVGQGLVEAFSEECPTCHGRGFLIHDEPTIEADAFDPYEVKGGDPFEKSKGRREAQAREQRLEHGSHPSSDYQHGEFDSHSGEAERGEYESRDYFDEAQAREERKSAIPQHSSQEVKAKLAAIAAAATAASQTAKAAEAAEAGRASQAQASGEVAAGENAAHASLEITTELSSEASTAPSAQPKPASEQKHELAQKQEKAQEPAQQPAQEADDAHEAEHEQAHETDRTQGNSDQDHGDQERSDQEHSGHARRSSRTQLRGTRRAHGTRTVHRGEPQNTPTVDLNPHRGRRKAQAAVNSEQADTAARTLTTEQTKRAENAAQADHVQQQEHPAKVLPKLDLPQVKARPAQRKHRPVASQAQSDDPDTVMLAGFALKIPSRVTAEAKKEAERNEQ
nr:Rne/Rng family ribonuclease [Aeriscardovia aeriphila]